MITQIHRVAEAAAAAPNRREISCVDKEIVQVNQGRQGTYTKCLPEVAKQQMTVDKIYLEATQIYRQATELARTKVVVFFSVTRVVKIVSK